MSNYIFQRLVNKANAFGINFMAATRQSREWFRAQAEAFGRGNISAPKMMDTMQTTVAATDLKIGRMYMFFYDPKWKEELPYYDKFPLIFPINFYKDGFLGINLHYLPPFHRAQLMDALYSTANNRKFDETTKLQISYDLLNGASKFAMFRPCLKRYLFAHVRSKFGEIDTKEWDLALMLPTERFEKASLSRVHQESVASATKQVRKQRRLARQAKTRAKRP